MRCVPIAHGRRVLASRAASSVLRGWVRSGVSSGLLAAVVGSAVGCGDEAECTTVGCQSGGGAGSGGAGSGGGASGSDDFLQSGGASSGSGGTAGTLADGEACRELVLSAEASPVNVHVMLDRSVSMLDPVDPADPRSPTRWDAITAALRAFVGSDEAAAARVGLQFFGLSNGNDDCSIDKYVTPAVEVAPLETNRVALLAAIDATFPGSLTPTAPAIEGALTYALQVAQRPENAERPTVVVLASDGIPSECGPTTADGTMVVSFAEIIDTLESFSQPQRDAEGEPLQPPILTYIVGTEELRNNADSLARAGGGQAFLLGAQGGADVEAQFLDALLSIVVKPLNCELDVPQTAPDTGEVIDFDAVRVRFTGASSGQTIEFPRTDGLGGCGLSRAWFYDDPAQPRKILFCRSACEALGAGDLRVELGCAPERIVR